MVTGLTVIHSLPVTSPGHQVIVWPGQWVWPYVIWYPAVSLGCGATQNKTHIILKQQQIASYGDQYLVAADGYDL